MKVYRMEKCSHGTTMIEDPFDGEWVSVADANKMIDLLAMAFNELCALQTELRFRLTHCCKESTEMMFCVHCEEPYTYDDRAAGRCPHCGKNPTGANEHAKPIATVSVVVPDHARGTSGRDNGDGSGKSAWPESYPVQERKTEGDKPRFRIGDTVNVSIEFAAGKYEGPAKVVTTQPLQIQFTFGPTKAKRTIAIGSDEVQ